VKRSGPVRSEPRKAERRGVLPHQEGRCYYSAFSLALRAAVASDAAALKYGSATALNLRHADSQPEIWSSRDENSTGLEM
jgi:hypothetical protein